MALIGSDFQVDVIVGQPRRCSECGKELKPGDTSLISVKKGQIRKRVCGEDCRLAFDARFWNEIAIMNAKRRTQRRKHATATRTGKGNPR
jgi:hypothetical protein